MKAIFLVILNFFILSTSAWAKNCEEVRFGLDIGSGSTKMLVAKVDFCQKKILETLLSESRPVSYNEDLEKNADAMLSPSIVKAGESVIGEFILKAKKFKPKKYLGVATSVFRKAKNGEKVIKEFSQKLHVKIKVISQEEEARLGFLAAQSILQTKDIVVWDIGGGSMQILSAKNKYMGELASVTFKNMVIEVIESKNPQSTSSPNPINNFREQVVALARAYARLHVSNSLKNEMKNKKIVGVGGVHNSAIKNQLQLKEYKYTLDELSKVGALQSKKTDDELSGDYRSTDVTNLLLVQGFMEALGINEVSLANATILQGLLLKN